MTIKYTDALYALLFHCAYSIHKGRSQRSDIWSGSVSVEHTLVLSTKSFPSVVAV